MEQGCLWVYRARTLLQKPRAHCYITQIKNKLKKVRQELSLALQPIFAQMASTVACHIVLPQGCAAADMKEKSICGSVWLLRWRAYSSIR